jgi:hypothetical protein
MSAAALLDRLHRVKQSAPGQWIARCPAHEDRSPSLSIRQLDDGRVLIHCFAGCEPGDVLAAVGLTLSDLFPARLPGHRYSAFRTTVPARDLLLVLAHEITVVLLILADISKDRVVNEEQMQRLCRAAALVGKARDMANSYAA